MTTDPAKRTDRTARKATAEQVMELSRNLPLTRSVPGRAVENATPGQLGFLAELFTAENASRAESKRNRLLRQAGFPQAKTLDGYDRGHGRVPHRLGTRTARVPRVHSATPRTSCSTDDAGMRAGPRLAIAIGTLACQQGIPVRFLRRLRPDHAATQGQNRQQTRPGTQDHRQGRPAHHRTGPATCPSTSTAPGSCPRIIADSHGKEKHHPPPRTRVRPVGRRVRRRRHGRRRHRPHRPATDASSGSTANPTETPTHS